MLEIGKRYKLIHKSETQRRNRQSVMVYLGEREKEYLFSARPKAGTQRMPKSWILKIDEVDPMTEVYVNRMHFGDNNG